MKNLLFTIWEEYLFGNPYGPYELHSTNIVVEPVKEEVLKLGLDNGTDSMDFILVDTGKYRKIEVQTWVAYHKRTNLPTYENIRVPQN